MASATYLHGLITTAYGLGVGEKAATILSRLTSITGADDDELAAKLGQLDPEVRAVLLARLVDVVCDAP